MSGNSRFEEYAFFDDIVVDVCISEEKKFYSISDKSNKLPIDAVIPNHISAGKSKEFRCKKCAAKLQKGAKSCPECGAIVVAEREYLVFDITVRVTSSPEVEALDFPATISTITMPKHIISKLIELHMIPNLHYSFKQIIRNTESIKSYTDVDGYSCTMPEDIICFESDLNYKPNLNAIDMQHDMEKLRKIVNDSLHTRTEMSSEYTVKVSLTEVRMFERPDVGTKDVIDWSKNNKTRTVNIAPFAPPKTSAVKYKKQITVTLSGGLSAPDIYYAVRSIGYDVGMPINWPKLRVPCQGYEVDIEALVCELGDYVIEMGPQYYL